MPWTLVASALIPSPPPLFHRRIPREAAPSVLRSKQQPPRAAISDPLVIELAEKLEDSLPTHSSGLLRSLRFSSSLSLLSKPFPSQKIESFRFTDTSFLRSSSVVPAPAPAPTPSRPPSLSAHSICLVDGHPLPFLSRRLPEGVYVGPISTMPIGSALDRVLRILDGEGGGPFSEGDFFWDLNGIGTPDVVVVYVPPGVRLVDGPIYLRFRSLEGAEEGTGRLPISNPRVVVVAAEGAELEIVEEHFGNGGMCYWANAVVEVVVGEGARVEHSYIQRQSTNAAHFKWTLVRQGSSSTYKLVDVSTGGRLSRHNLHIQQLGPDTVTELSSFHLSQMNQIQDLHSKLILDHPRGYSRQTHKSIVTHSSGQTVFDGNIKVNRFAQQTDAGQLTRTLLLAPRATANVKPNLQIVADDVKCSHGAAISDLEDDQLFYFRTRGIDQESARDALVFSFGAEVVAQLPFEPLKKEVSTRVKQLLSSKTPFQ